MLNKIGGCVDGIEGRGKMTEKIRKIVKREKEVTLIVEIGVEVKKELPIYFLGMKGSKFIKYGIGEEGRKENRVRKQVLKEMFLGKEKRLKEIWKSESLEIVLEVEDVNILRSLEEIRKGLKKEEEKARKRVYRTCYVREKALKILKIEREIGEMGKKEIGIGLFKEKRLEGEYIIGESEKDMEWKIPSKVWLQKKSKYINNYGLIQKVRKEEEGKGKRDSKLLIEIRKEMKLKKEK